MSLRVDETDLEITIASLSIVKSISDLMGSEVATEYIPIEVSWGGLHHLYFSALELCGSIINSKYFDCYDVEITALMNDNMTEYYKCAYRLGELRGLPETLNPYLKLAAGNVMDTIADVNHYTFDFHLYKSKRRKPRLMLITSDEYYPNAEVIYQLCRFICFFNNTLPALKSELESLENESKKVKPIRKVARKRRKAA